jgi:hypothetical protein
MRRLVESRWFAGLLKGLIVLGWLTLPYTHLRWLPNFGLTRPLTAILFTGALGMLVLRGVVMHWAAIWKRTAPRFLIDRLAELPGGWRLLRWWLALFALGVISAALTPLYGNFIQALNRLLSYTIILAYVAVALFSLKTYGIRSLARWIAAGYLPVLLYGAVEALAIGGMSWALGVVAWVRGNLLVSHPWVGRLALFTTEPSFASFHLVLLGVIFPYLRAGAPKKKIPHRNGEWLEGLWVWVLRGVVLGVSLLTIVFSTSGTLFVMLAGWIGSWLLLGLPRRWLVRLAGAAALLALAGGVAWLVVPGLADQAGDLWLALWSTRRMNDMRLSITIRGAYIASVIWAIIETRGLGLGIGQYGYFWREIYLRHIDYRAFDVTGEVGRMLASTGYMRPWSVIFGLGADLGLVGMALFGGFIANTWQACRGAGASAYGRALIIAGLLALVGTYPIVTPHVWLALALLGGRALGRGELKD